MTGMNGATTVTNGGEITETTITKVSAEYFVIMCISKKNYKIQNVQNEF